MFLLFQVFRGRDLLHIWHHDLARPDDVRVPAAGGHHAGAGRGHHGV